MKGLVAIVLDWTNYNELGSNELANAKLLITLFTKSFGISIEPVTPEAITYKIPDYLVDRVVNFVVIGRKEFSLSPMLKA